MRFDIKTLSSGLLKGTTAALLRGEVVLYAAPHPSEPFSATTKRAAMLTALRFFNASPSASATMSLYFAKYDSARPLRLRPRRQILPLNLKLNPGELKVETTPLVLEEGDALLAGGSLANLIQYVISGVESDV
jgi:hypothetical protein